ncbi:MAG: copper transport protein [Gaiellales bacterium]|nr:copper transport protein [Gaiellales bacterium]
MLPSVAQAHTSLIDATPTPGSVVASAPAELRLRFDQQIRPVANGTKVQNASGESVIGGDPQPDPNDVTTLVIPLKGGLEDGDYTVRWQIVSTDGHIISGIYAIGVGAGRAPPQAVSEETPTDWLFLISRFVYFAGLLLLVGGVAYRVAVHAPVAAEVDGEPGRMMGVRERHRANQLLAASAVLVLAGGWVALTRQGAQVAGVSFWEAFDHRGPVASALDATRFGRQFGRGIDVTAVFTILVALAYAAAGYDRRLTYALSLPAAAAGMWALAAPGIAGHAGDPGRGPLVMGLDAIHVAAAAAWIGGLAQLTWVTPHATRGLADDVRDRVRTAIAGRFSRIALCSVAVLSATGVARAFWELDSITQVWTTSYGRVLMLKIALLVVILAIASQSRRLLGRFQSLRRSVAAELAVAAGVVAAVALLTNLPPGSTPAAGEAATNAAAPGGPATVVLGRDGSLSAWPGAAGPNAFVVRLPVRFGTPTLLVDVTGGSTTTIDLRRMAPGVWAGIAPKVAEGTASAQVAAGDRTWAATVPIGGSLGPGAPPPPFATGPLAAAQAGNLAVALQRVSPTRARVTVLGPQGTAPRNAVVAVGRTVAAPCPGGRQVCYLAPVPREAGAIPVSVLAAEGRLLRTTVHLPAANAQPAADLVGQTASALRALKSVRIENELSSGPGQGVHTTFVSQAPDRLSIEVVGGTTSRIIGAFRYDLRNGAWQKGPTPATRQPDPYWAKDATAAYIARRSPDTLTLTFAVNQGPTFFELVVDRKTMLVQQLHMIAAAHFMDERYLDVNRAAPVVPPPGA